MNISIHLEHNNGFKWHSNGEVSFKGFFIHQNQYLSGEQALQLLGKNLTEDKLNTIVSQANGLFTLIAKFPDKLWVAVDRVRSFPLFYTNINSLIISDNPYSLPHKEIDTEAAREFVQTGFTIGRSTLKTGIFQTQASEILIFTKNKIQRKRYYSHQTRQVFQSGFEQLAIELKSLLFRVFEDFIRTLNHQPVALSLSGGYDSRLIALMLKHFDYQNVFCFTYGRKTENPELENSQQTAKILGFDWKFRSYDYPTPPDYLQDKTFVAYTKFAAKLSSMPYLQDYFAVKQLKEQGILQPNHLFVSGHSGDFLAGSHLRGRLKQETSPQKITKQIYASHFKLSHLSDKKIQLKKIRAQIGNTQNFGYSVFEDWDMNERQAKFIVNSASVYDFFGFEYRLPLWDTRLMDFFRQVPLCLKNYKILYDFVLRDIFADYQLNFEHELQPSSYTVNYQNIKDQIKKHLPTTLLKKMQKPAHPWHCYDILTAPMLDALKGSPFEKNLTADYNSVICNWYLKNLHE